MKRVLNVHVMEGEHAWVKAWSKTQGASITDVVRDMIRDHMRRALAEDGIASGLRCSRQDCLERPTKSGERPDLCRDHAIAAAALAKHTAALHRRARR